jgi:hypothetical protein
MSRAFNYEERYIPWSCSSSCRMGEAADHWSSVSLRDDLKIRGYQQDDEPISELRNSPREVRGG